MEDVVTPVAAKGRPRGWYAAGLVGAGLVAGLVVAGLNVASAQTSPSPSPQQKQHRMLKPFRGEHGPFGRKGEGLEGALHGQFTAKAPGGGYRTMAMQVGDVTSVSATSIAVKSEDGFTKTYVVNDDTMVNAGDTGIGDVKTGDKVRVLAVVAGDTFTAIHVGDVTNVGAWRQHWFPGPPKPSPSSAT